MSSDVLREIQKSLDRPTRQEILERLQARPVRELKRSAAALIRLEREASRHNSAEMLHRFGALSSVETRERTATIVGKSRPRR